MPTFDTPEPISAVLDLVVGDLGITATDRGETSVEVHPSDPSSEPDVRAAEQTRVEYADGRLLVKAPKQRRAGLFGKPGSIDVTIELPTGSRVQADGSVLALRGVGLLGESRIRAGVGNIQLDRTGALDAHTGAGGIVVNRVTGRAELNTGSGRVDVAEVDGPLTVKNSNGASRIGRVTGDLRVNAANGEISVDTAQAGVTVNTANGDIRVGELVRGTASFRTAFGEIDVAIASGTAARLDAHTHFGKVHSQLEPVDSPKPSDESVDVRARTSYGDIVIRRSHTQH
ncbi:MAG: DUF4097 family beta strand repeat-containing protein [Actinocatenispora sp.]